MVRSATLFFLRGPVAVVGTAIGIALTAWGIFEFIRDESFWMWLCLGALALVAVSFGTFHRQRVAHEQSLPQQLDNLIREGLELLKDLSDPVPDPASEKIVVRIDGLSPEERLERVDNFRDRAYDLLVENSPSSLPDITIGMRVAHEERGKEWKEQLEGLEGPPALLLRIQAKREEASIILQGLLDGLREVRHRVGVEG